MMIWTVEDLVRGIRASTLEKKVKTAAVRDVRELDNWDFVKGLGERTVAEFTRGALTETFERFSVPEMSRSSVENVIYQTLISIKPYRREKK